MFAKLQKFIDIQTKLPKNLQENTKKYAEELVKKNKNAIFTTKEKAKEMRKEIQNKILTIAINPHYTSKICPRCEYTLKFENTNNLHRLFCEKCKFEDNRDHVTITNIAKKFLKLLCKLE